jgi:hypothetical protein
MLASVTKIEIQALEYNFGQTKSFNPRRGFYLRWLPMQSNFAHF